MRGKEMISPGQLTCITAGFLIGTAIIFSFTQNYAGRDAWIAELISAGGGLIILLINGYIAAKYPGKEAAEILEELFNPLLAKLLLIFFFIYALLLAAFVFNEIEAFMVTMIMQETPSWVFILTFALTVGIIIRYGLEVFARCTEISIIIILVSVLFMLVIGFRLINFKQLVPLFTEGYLAITKATIISSFFPYLESGVLLFITVHVKKSEKIYKAHFGGLLIAAGILFLRPIYINGVFGTESGPDLVYPIFSLVRQITLGEFLERVELVMLIAWFLSVFVKLGVCVFVLAKSLQGIFKLKDYKKLVMPLVLLLIPFGIKAYANFQDPQIFISSGWPLINIPLQIIPLAVIFIVCVYKSKGKNSYPHEFKEGGEEGF